VSRWACGLLAVASLVAGAATGLAAVAVHSTAWGWPLAVATVLLVAYALPGEWWARLPFCWAFAGVAFALTQTRPSGGFLVSADLPGYGLLGVAAMVAVLGPVGTIRGKRATAP
jgi:hypothetical protein